MYDSTFIQDIDQLMLEYVNRARLNPTSEANLLLEGNLNQGLAENSITSTPKQPLAFNLNLFSSAKNHSQWMLDNDIFSHTGVNGTSAHQRMGMAGYQFIPSWGSGENIAWKGSTGSVDFENWVIDNHEGLFISPGHRLNILNDNFQEVGIASLVGVFTKNNIDYNAVMTTQNFAYSANGGAFLTGVIYDDSVVDDDFYSIGEGIDNVTITAQKVGSTEIYETENWLTGGYTLYLPSGEYNVSFVGDLNNDSHIDTVNRTVTINSQNIKLDILATDVTPIEKPPLELIINNKGNNQTTEIKPYSVQDDEKSKVKNTVSGTNGLRIDGNGWKGVNIGNYQVTANTVLEFDFYTTSEGEIQGIGLDNDNNYSNSTNQIFQLLGIQTYGNQAFNNYQLGNGWKSYSIKVGDYFTGNIDRLSFINDDDRTNGNSWSAYRDVTLREETPPLELVINNNGNNQTTEIQPYSVQDDEKSKIKNTLSGTNGLRIDGNGWKGVNIGDYQVTANTVLEFEFYTTSEGEIQGIGLDNDNNYTNSSNQIFQLLGTQPYGNQAFNNYQLGNGWKSYSIKVGDYFTGNIDRLSFINDDDRTNGNSWSAYRDVTLREENPELEINFDMNQVKSYSNQDDLTSRVKNTVSGTNGIRMDGNSWKSLEIGDSLINPNTVLNFEYYTTSEGEIQGIGVDNDNDYFNSRDQIFQLFGTQTYGNQAFNDYELGEGWKSYSIGIGQYFIGEIDRVTFINDDDRANPVSWSAFRNVSFTNLTTL